MSKMNYLGILLIWGILVTNGLAQDILTVGLSKYTTELRGIIEQEGYHIDNVDYNKIDADHLAGKTAVALFNLRQTWDASMLLSEDQVDELIEFVNNGGALYLTARKGYGNLLERLGVLLVGKDGGSTGRDWPLKMEKITAFEAHYLSNQLRIVAIDVSALLQVDQTWTIVAKGEKDNPMLVTKNIGSGKIIIGSGERIFRDAYPTTNRYETDISKGDNYRYHQNILRYLAIRDHVQLETEVEGKDLFKVFPNPTNGQLNIVGEEMTNIIIIDSKGQQLQAIQLNKVEQAVVDLSNYPSGIYWLKIRSTKGWIAKEVIVH